MENSWKGMEFVELKRVRMETLENSFTLGIHFHHLYFLQTKVDCLKFQLNSRILVMGNYVVNYVHKKIDA